MVGRILTAALQAAGLALFFLGLAPLVRWIGRRAPKILLYHDCADEETSYTAGLECTTSVQRFAEHMEWLSRNYRIVDVETIVGGDAPERAVAVTFDDGYASVYQNAFPALKKYRVPATVYLISSAVDNRTLVWVNELNWFLHRHGVQAVECVRDHFAVDGSATPDEIITFCRLHYRPEKMTALLEQLRRKFDKPVAEHAAEASLYLTWNAIEEMTRAGIEFGNHSRTHANMERLTEDEQREEIELAQAELSSKLPRVRAFAHPFGHHGPSTASLAANAGLGSVAEVGGANSPVSPLRLGRTHISNESVAGLFARMEVVEPIKEIIRRRTGRSRPATIQPRSPATAPAI